MRGKRKAVTGSVAGKGVPKLQEQERPRKKQSHGEDVPHPTEAVPVLRPDGIDPGGPGHDSAPAGGAADQEARGIPDSVPVGGEPLTWRNERARVGDLVDWERNPRTLTRQQAEQLDRSLKKFGFVDPLVVNADGKSLIGGHARKKVLLNLANVKPDFEVPVRIPSRQLTAEEVEELAIRLNRNTGAWDWDMLANIFDEGKLLDWGFEPKEFGKVEDPRDGAAVRGEPHDPVTVAPESVRVKHGDVWEIGLKGSRIICASPTDQRAVHQVMGTDRIDFVFTSIPTPKTDDHDKVIEALRTTVRNFLAYLEPGRCVAWAVGTSRAYQPHLQFAMLESEGLFYQRQIIWKKIGAVIPAFFRTRERPVARYFTPDYVHEAIGIFANGELKYGAEVSFDNALASDVFELMSGSPLDSPKSKKGEELKVDVTVTPLQLSYSFIQHLSDKGTVVFDPFAGAGSTILAAESLGRVGIGIEGDPRYCEAALRRAERMGIRVRGPQEVSR